MQNNKTLFTCGTCLYWDRESILINGDWKKTNTGYCLNENGIVNNQQFYSKCYINTTVKCSVYKIK